MKSPPILARIILLVAATLLLALGAMLIVTFRGPPPHGRPLDMVEVAQALKTGRIDSGWAMQRRHDARAPTPDAGMRIDPAGSAALAQILGTDADNARLIRYDHGGPPPGMRPPPFGPGGPRMRNEVQGGAVAAWRDGTGWTVVTLTQRTALRWYGVTLSLMAGIFALLLIPAIVIARRIAMPIRTLAEFAAADHAPDIAIPATPGPPEVQQLREAFGGMRGRLAGHLAERTQMLVAIAHDLRTPMTRLSFRLEHLPDAERAKAQADIGEMRAMVASLLDFVRGESAQVAFVRLDLAAILQTLADDMTDMAQDVRLFAEVRAVISGDPALLRRCIGNVLENAVRYGGAARMALSVADGRAALRIEDDGPGIPPDQLARICEPFFRGEQSRNRATGGVGLGLSIARSIVERHGGSIGFANRPGGGLIVSIMLPLAGSNGARTAG